MRSYVGELVEVRVQNLIQDLILLSSLQASKLQPQVQSTMNEIKREGTSLEMDS